MILSEPSWLVQVNEFAHQPCPVTTLRAHSIDPDAQFLVAGNVLTICTIVPTTRTPPSLGNWGFTACDVALGLRLRRSRLCQDLLVS